MRRINLTKAGNLTACPAEPCLAPPKLYAKGRRSRGFTLVELLIVIAVTGALVSLVMFFASTARTKARDSQRVSDIKQMQTALELYFNRESSYPTTWEAGTPLTGPSGKVYMNKRPVNPSPRAEGACADLDYVYSSANGSTYSIDYCLANKVSDLNSGSCIAVPGNMASCVNSCGAGQYKVNGVGLCVDVGLGYYSSANATRTACPTNTTTTITNASSINDCVTNTGLFAGPSSSNRALWTSNTAFSTADTGGDDLVSASWNDPGYGVSDSYYYQLGFTGLEGWWRMNGNANDSSPNGRNATIYGAPNNATLTTDRFGQASSAYLFDGTNKLIGLGDYNAFTFADDSTDKPFTLSAWIKPAGWYDNGVTSGFVIMSKALYPYAAGGRVAPYAEWAFYILSNGQLTLRLFNSDVYHDGGAITPASLVALNNWYHVVATYDGRGGASAWQGIAIYVNNVPPTMSDYASTDYTKMQNSTYQAEVGRFFAGGATNEYLYANGVIDDARIYNRALSSTEIGIIYNEGTRLGVKYVDSLPVTSGTSTLYVNSTSSPGVWGTEKSFIFNHN